MRQPNSGLPEFGNIIIQAGYSRLGCAGPESILPVVVMDSGLARSLSSGGAERRPVGAPRNNGVNFRQLVRRISGGVILPFPDETAQYASLLPLAQPSSAVEYGWIASYPLCIAAFMQAYLLQF